jgi:hypothetical protein
VTEAGPGSQHADVLRALIADGFTFAEALAVFAQANTRLDTAYIEAARTIHQDPGTLEIDNASVTSGSGDDGDYVLAWVWVNDSSITDPEAILWREVARAGTR